MKMVGRYLLVIGLALIAILPIGLIFVMSLRDSVDIFANPLRFIFMPTLENYRSILFEDNFARYLLNSLLVGVISTVITLFLSCMAAFGLARFQFFGRKVFAYTSLLLRTIPLAVLAIPVFMIWNEVGLVNSLGGLIVLYVGVNLPFTIWLLYGFILQIPKELEEAAQIDGASFWQIFYQIVLPLIKPAIAVAGIFTFRIGWNEFILALVLTNRTTRTLPVAASLFITDMGVDWAKIMAMASLIAVLPIIFTFMASK